MNHIVARDTFLPPHAAAGPDYELIVNCDGYIAVWQTILGFHTGPNAIADDRARGAATEPFYKMTEKFLDVVACFDIQAVTLQGLQARARAANIAANLDGVPYEGQIAGEAEEIAQCLLRDLIEYTGPLA